MTPRRFRPTLDRLPDRMTPSGCSAPMAPPAPPAESISPETTQVSYPTITCCEYREADDFYA
jgi:hypothetical protein